LEVSVGEATTEALNAHHRAELEQGSAIDPSVIAERGYVTVGRPNASLLDAYGRNTREAMSALGFPGWSIREDYYFPGMQIPQYTPRGDRYAGQWKPFRPVPNRDGKPMKYASAKGPARIDVHPRWSRDRGAVDPTLLPAIQDPTLRLWVTEGVKKADSLTSQGEVTVALAGVFNWRNGHASLGDWEDVRLKDREVVICFDADAVTKTHVAQAMARLGKWLKYKGAKKVWFLVVPSTVENDGVLLATKGVDDYFAAGGTLKGLEQAFESKPPDVTDTEDKFTDARLAETLTAEVLDGRYIWCKGLEWLRFNGNVWGACTEVSAMEEVRTWGLDHFREAADRLKLDDRAAGGEVDGWKTMLGKNRAGTVLKWAQGLVEHTAEDLDVDVERLNTSSGYLDLEKGLIEAVGGNEYPTRITNARFDPDAVSEVWETFIQRILPDQNVRLFVQRLFGYSLLGEVREHVMPIFTGEGANGKSTLRDAVLHAMGDYALEVDPELLMQSHNPRHLTFLMELMGRRMVFCSETEKGRAFGESMMKRLVDGSPIQANRMRQDPITFMPSHTLIMMTNFLPKVSGDDPAVWRRILVVPFDVVIPVEERDSRLPGKLREPDVSAAVLAWMYRGFRDYQEQGLNPPQAVQGRTAAYKAESDVTGRFIGECLVAEPGSRLMAKDLFERYVMWFRAEGSKDDVPLSKAELGKELVKRGFQAAKYGGSASYKGVAFTPTELEE
jgi:putative DNA primase/helicase